MDYSKKIADFFKGRGGIVKAVVIALIGVVLLAISAGGGAEEAAAEDELTKEVREFCEAIDGVGKCRVMISYEYETGGYLYSSERGRVMAVAVACRGADKVEVRKKLTDLLCASFDIGANRVSVFKLE